METERILQALKMIDYEIVDTDLDFFINYVLEKHYNIYKPLYTEYRLVPPKYFFFIYKLILPYL